MKNFKITVVTAVVFLMAAAVNAEAMVAEVVSMAGEVSYHSAGEQAWQAAEVGLTLKNGSAVKSGSASEVKLNFSNGHQTVLGANSSMEIKSLGRDTTLELFKGKLKSRVRKLAGKEQYNVKTAEGVASVRGTFFEVVRIGNNTDVKVDEGSVNVKELATGQSVKVDAGKFTKVKKNKAPTPPDDLENYKEPVDNNEGDQTKTGEEQKDKDQEKTADKTVEKLQDKDGDETVDGGAVDSKGIANSDVDANEDSGSEDALSGGLSGDVLKEDLRSEMREAVNDIKVDIGSAQDLVEQQKNSDASTGRTLRDVHGNLVRVEQHIERPDNNTIGIINITKRDNYKYTGRFEALSTGPRLDTIELITKFNREMPEKLSGWGSFIQELAEKDGGDFHPESVKIEIANNVGGSRDKIKMTAAWDETKDDMGDEVIKFTSADKGIWNIDNDYEDDGDGVEWDGIDEDSNSGSIEMWAISPKIKLFRDADGNGICDIGESNKIVRVGIENWLINNDGEVMNIDKLLGLKSSINPFEALRNIAMENALMVRDSEDIGLIANHSYTPVEYENIRKEFNNGNAFFKYNMDNILTPDFAIPIIEKVAADAASDL